MALTVGQSEALRYVIAGHTLFLSGQAESCKSRVVRSIIKECHRKNRVVAVACASGIACKVDRKGVASTVHSFYGLGAADLPSSQLLERSKANTVVSRKIRDVDVVIWDEVSMSSMRMLELVNCLRHDLVSDNNQFPFAGKQFILVGEFLQLRPVPSKFDYGKFMFYSDVFRSGISHRFELTEIMRQLNCERELLDDLKELRFGVCAEETHLLLSGLSRNLAVDVEATHIFFKKILAMLFNRAVLDKVPGKIFRFDGSYERRTENMR